MKVKSSYIFAGAILASITGAVIVASQDKTTVVNTTHPYIITKGGHYTGSFRGSKDTAAIWIWTTDSVFLDSPKIICDAGGGIRMSGGTKVTVLNPRIEGVAPTGKYQYGRAIDDYQPSYFKMTGFEISNTGGILFDHSKPGTSPLIQVYNGLIKNTSRLKGDGTGGGLRAGMQFNTVRNMNPASEAAWIEWNNEPGKSWVEDNFNFYNSSNFKLHDFIIRGAYPYPVTASSYSGSGVTSDGSPQEGNTKENATHNFEVYNGTIISTCNAAANIAAGYNVNFHDLTIISSGMLPDGTKSNRFWSGTCIFNAGKYLDSIFYNNRIQNCTIGFVNNGNENYPFTGRQDENKDRKVNKMPEGGNRFLPNPVTLDMENNYYALFRNKAIASGYAMGIPAGNSPSPAQTPAQTPPPPVIVSNDTPKPSEPVSQLPAQPVKRDTVRLPAVHDTTILYVTARYAVVGYDTVKINKQ